MKDIIKRIALWFVHGIIGLCLLTMLVVFVADYTAGCGQTYIDAAGNTKPVAKNSECLIIKHHEPPQSGSKQ